MQSKCQAQGVGLKRDEKIIVAPSVKEDTPSRFFGELPGWRAALRFPVEARTLRDTAATTTQLCRRHLESVRVILVVCSSSIRIDVFECFAARLVLCVMCA